MVFKPIDGVDYSWARPSPSGLHRAGKRFAVRYLSWASSGRGRSVLDGHTNGKVLTKSEATKLQAAGLDVVSNWEYTARDQLRGRAGGRYDAAEAERIHKACGGPSAAPIYFSTDFDASTSQLSTCHDYLRGAADVLGWDRVGVYGGYRTIDYMADRGVDWLWQTYAWSRGRWDGRAQLQQYRNGVRLAGGDVDLNRATTSTYGQWGAAGAHPSAPGSGSGASDPSIDLLGGDMLPLKHGDESEDVQLAQRLLLAVGEKLPKYGPDRSYGDETAAAVSSFWKKVNPDVTYSGREVTSAIFLHLLLKACKGEKGDPGEPGKDGVLDLPVGVEITGSLTKVEP